MTSTSLNPNAAPWWPEGSDGAEPSCEPRDLTNTATPSGERLQQDPVRSARKKAFRRACNHAGLEVFTIVVHTIH